MHVSDLTSLYALLITKIIHKEPLLSGEEGYYFAYAHQYSWHETLEALAKAMKARGILEKTDDVGTWPSMKVAAETLAFPEQFIPLMLNAG